MSDEVEYESTCGSCEMENENIDCPDTRLTNRSPKMKNALIARLKRIEGQVRGIQGMIEKDIYCDDVLNQIAAVQSALKSVGKLLLESHMKSCMINRVKAGDTEVVDELLCTIDKLLK